VTPTLLAEALTQRAGAGRRRTGTHDAATEIYAETPRWFLKCRQGHSARQLKKIASDVVIMAFNAPVKRQPRGQTG
jgi:hypothetical protein